MSITVECGRLGNQIIRNLAISIIAEKNDLFVTYSSHDVIKQMGFELFVGKNSYERTEIINDENYFDILSKPNINYNLDGKYSFFQTKKICNFLYNYIHSSPIQSNIKKCNPFNERYEMNNDLCVHIRLGDSSQYSPGIDYYINTSKQIPNKPENIYLCTDEKSHPIVQQYLNEFPNTIIIDDEPYRTIQFASTCKYLILSHGSFSSIIGYLGFHSSVYYPKYEDNKMWYGDMFSIPNWNCL